MSFLVSSRLRPLRFCDRETRLSFFPQSLTITEVIQIIVLFTLRQILYLIGFGKDIRSTTTQDAEHFVLPELRLSMPFKLDANDSKVYAAAVGLNDFDSALSNSAQACLLLSAFSEPAMLLLLASQHCPIRPLGAVNVRNRFELLKPELCTADALSQMEAAELRARLSSEPRRAKRGLEIDLEVDIVNLDRDVTVFRQTFTMLQFMKFKNIPSTLKEQTQDDHPWAQATSTYFKMTSDAPLAWANICKDYNVLHISTVAARMLGFGGKIAHGNHALSLGISSLSNSQIDLCDTAAARKGVTMEVQFRKPMILPATFTAQAISRDDRSCLKITKGNQTCLTATLELSSCD